MANGVGIIKLIPYFAILSYFMRIQSQPSTAELITITMAGVQFQPLFQAARNGAVPGGARDGDVRDGAAHDGYGATHNAARDGAVCDRASRPRWGSASASQRWGRAAG